jgi:hypothetical protein
MFSCEGSALFEIVNGDQLENSTKALFFGVRVRAATA